MKKCNLKNGLIKQTCTVCPYAIQRKTKEVHWTGKVQGTVSGDVSSALEETDSQCEAVDKNTESQSRGGRSQSEEQKGSIRICHEKDKHSSRCHLTRQMDRQRGE